MPGDTMRQGSDEPSLERIREASDEVQKSTAAIVLEKVRDRWQTVAGIVVLIVTSFLLYRVDEGLSMDAQIFGIISILLLIYFLLTLRTDVSME